MEAFLVKLNKVRQRAVHRHQGLPLLLASLPVLLDLLPPLLCLLLESQLILGLDLFKELLTHFVRQCVDQLLNRSLVLHFVFDDEAVCVELPFFVFGEIFQVLDRLKINLRLSLRLINWFSGRSGFRGAATCILGKLP